MDDASRYKAKLCVGEKVLPDPYGVDEAYWTSDLVKVPLVAFPDIFVYLVESSGTFTSDKLKAYKSMESWNVFVSGHVGLLKLCHFEEAVFVKAIVQASQAASKSYEAWCLCKPDGTILSAHCQCMAGMGEACSHVAAILFKIQTAVLLGLNEKASTSKACKWNQQFSKKVEPCTIKDIAADMGIPVKRRKVEFGLSDGVLLRELQNLPGESAIKTPLPVSTSGMTDNRVDLPYPLYKMFNILKKQVPGSHAMSREYGLQLLKKLKHMYPESLIKNVETATVGQANCKEWFNQRHGRLTASLFGEIVSHVDGGRVSVSLLKKVVEPSGKLMNVPSMCWGRTNEPMAREAVKESLGSHHENLDIRECGLFISKERPFVAASPDGMITCSCCEPRVLEIKCPYSLRDKSPLNAECLDGEGHLKNDHPYMYQVQGQMMVCEVKSCLFCLYVPGHTPHMVHVEFSESIADALVRSLDLFYVDEVIPALLR